MAVLTTLKPHSAQICGGMITLERYFLGSSPDELGTLAQWEASLWPMYNAIPFPDLWRGLKVRVWHMDHPQLEDETRAGIANLQDYDTVAGGYQVAAGLYWNKQKLDIGVFPDGWRPEDPPMARVITAAAVANALLVLAHEAGHFNGDLSGYGKTQYLVQREITRLFGALTVSLAGQASNGHELWAELHRAFSGPPGARGYFSDGKPYSEAHNPKLFTLMAVAYWLHNALQATEFDQLQAWDDRILWLQYKRVWGFKVEDGWYSVDRQWRKTRWNGSAWLLV